MARLRLGLWQSPGELDGVEARLAWLRVQCEASPGLDLALLPELFLSGYNAGPAALSAAADQMPALLASVAALARTHGLALAFGYPERAGDALYNTACLIDATGTVQLRHRKRVLPPGFEATCFAVGERAPEVVALCGVRVALLVCFEVEFPEAVRALARADAELVLVPTALGDAWGIVAQQVVPTRAFENSLFVAYANHAGVEQGERYLGESCIVSATGACLARAGAEPTRLFAEIDTDIIAPWRARLPFLAQSAALRPTTG
ncbi:MAG: nitrilase-related carbon-nitrogen hydrolase [Pseudomonadota bacterium]